MAAGMAFLIVILVIIAIVTVPIVWGFAGGSRERLDSEQKRELKELRKFKQDVRIVTARQRDINPELATQIDGLLYDFDTKELG